MIPIKETHSAILSSPESLVILARNSLAELGLGISTAGKEHARGLHLCKV